MQTISTTDLAHRLRVRERVTRRARQPSGLAVDEQLLAPRLVGVRRNGFADAGAAARGRAGENGQSSGGRSPHYLADAPIVASASSREGWIVKTRSRPVISKIFVMFRSLQTSES